MRERIKIKVCGMRDPENIRRIERLDIDWMGFIFHPRSPRYVPDDEPFVDAVRRCTKVRVGVFVNTPADEIKAKALRYKLDILQLHGDESPADCDTLRQQGYRIIKAFPVATTADLSRTAAYAACVHAFLFDTKTGRHGGSGRRFDWSLLHACPPGTPFLLSGGISPESIPDLRRFSHPQMAGIDLNSRFESAPAVKDATALEQFVTQFRNIKYK
jgi:phosphoribosylanthranilate isomerase